MPWQLTTPVNTGDLDASNYAEVKIVGVSHRTNQKLISVELEYGNTVDGEWVRGHTPIGKVSSHVIEGQKYTDLITTHATQDGELSYDAAKRGLFEHLVAEGVTDPGAVV